MAVKFNLSVPKGIRARLFPQIESFNTARLFSDPTNPELHFEFAKHCSSIRNNILAHAEARTARSLGLNSEECIQLIENTLIHANDLQEIEHNQYYRYLTLANEIERFSTDESSTLIDVGGGSGMLAQFIPPFEYCLAEPTINGISGIDLPFSDGRFDMAVSCHVLEHIPLESRTQFLDQLVAVSRNGVILLNPFNVEGTFVTERLRLFVELTGAEWAKEHLDCTLPEISFVEDYASARGLAYRIRPNGSVTTSMAMFFASHFMQKAGCQKELRKLSAFYNGLPIALLDSLDYPTAYLVTLTK